MTDQLVDIKINVNGKDVTTRVAARATLVDFLRDDLRLTGTHAGCEQGICGTCTVLVDGKAMRSCLMLAVQADSRQVLTVEGLGGVDTPHPLQESFSRHRGLQCGFCTPGFLMIAAGLLKESPAPTDERIADAASANLCRCTSYSGILRAMREVIHGTADATDD